MFDNLLQGNLSNMLQQTGLTPQQAAQALPAAQESVTNTLQTEATSGNFANIAGLFAGQADNPLTSILSNNMVQSLMSKVGLSSSVATTAATAFLPQIITTLKQQVLDESGNISQARIMSLLGGGSVGNIVDSVKDKLGGIGNLFGK